MYKNCDSLFVGFEITSMLKTRVIVISLSLSLFKTTARPPESTIAHCCPSHFDWEAVGVVLHGRCPLFLVRVYLIEQRALQRGNRQHGTAHTRTGDGQLNCFQHWWTQQNDKNKDKQNTITTTNI
jgi:hypothetical protein